MANRYMEICLTSPVIWEMQNKYIMRSHLIPIRMAIIKKITIVGKDVEKKESFYTVGGNVHWYR